METQKEMSFLDHLEELRWHIIRALAAVMIAATAAFLAKAFIFETLIFGPTKADFFTYEFLCNASKLLGFESFCDTNFDFAFASELTHHVDFVEPQVQCHISCSSAGHTTLAN